MQPLVILLIGMLLSAQDQAIYTLEVVFPKHDGTNIPIPFVLEADGYDPIKSDPNGQIELSQEMLETYAAANFRIRFTTKAHTKNLEEALVSCRNRNDCENSPCPKAFIGDETFLLMDLCKDVDNPDKVFFRYFVWRELISGYNDYLYELVGCHN